MTKKQITRAVAFFLVLMCMFCFLSDVFENKSNRRNTTSVRTYYSLERDTLDVALLGTSGIDRYWLASKAYEEQGLATFALSTNHFPSWIMMPMIKDIVRKHKSLKLLVVDMRPFTTTYTGSGIDKYENRARICTEALPFFSLARFEAINRALKTINENVEGASRFDISYFFTFIKHHSRWTEKDFDLYDEVEYKISDYMGAYMHKYFSLKTMDEPIATSVSDARSPLDLVCLENLYELFNYFEKQTFEVLFLNTPHSQSRLETRRINYLCDILDENGYKYLNCNLDGTVYDLKNDFYNAEHMNYYGAEKFTNEFANYLVKHYGFSDHRGDGRYYQWEGTYDNIRKTVAGWEEKRKS